MSEKIPELVVGAGNWANCQGIAPKSTIDVALEAGLRKSCAIRSWAGSCLPLIQHGHFEAANNA